MPGKLDPGNGRRRRTNPLYKCTKFPKNRVQLPKNVNKLKPTGNWKVCLIKWSLLYKKDVMMLYCKGLTRVLFSFSFSFLFIYSSLIRPHFLIPREGATVIHEFRKAVSGHRTVWDPLEEIAQYPQRVWSSLSGLSLDWWWKSIDDRFVFPWDFPLVSFELNII